MINPETAQDNNPGPDVAAQIAPMFDDLRRFVDRRFAELSTELHATTLLLDYSETNLTGQLSRIHEQIAAVVAAPALATRNSGLELEAVVQTTETAANRIMEAAEAIGDWLRNGARDADSVEAIAQQVNNIFEACTFQDVTGQRIRRAIKHLQHVESMLTEIMPQGAAAGPVPDTPEPAAGGPDLFQNDVDKMFA